MLTLDTPPLSVSTDFVPNHRILIVEDEEVIRDMIILALEEEGYEALGVSDGRVALELLQSQESNHGESRFDLVVLDLMLPQVNGLDICRLLRYHGNIIPILILSAKASETDRVLGLEVGADEGVFNKVKPLFELMGKNINLVGGNGAGQTAKVANQIIVALNIEAVGEALLFAAKAGADPAKVRQALMGGFASSKILEVHGERMVNRTFNPGFRIELHQKDLNLALSSAKALGVSLPNTATAQALFNSCAAHGGKAWDHSAMVKALEKLANFEIGQKAP